MKCLYRFTDCKIQHLVENVDNEGGRACVRAEGMWEISVPSAQLCCESKIAFKKFFFFF